MTAPLVEVLRSHLEQNHLELTELADGTAVLVDLQGHQVLSLNRTGTLLSRKLVAGNCQHEDLIRALTDAYEVAHDQAAADVDEFLATLARTLNCPS